jgi:putative ABC transport system substrate-binding protein
MFLALWLAGRRLGSGYGRTDGNGPDAAVRGNAAPCLLWKAKRTVGGWGRQGRTDPFQKAELSGYDGLFWPKGLCMKRRQFITLFGGAVAWPLAARAQQSTIRVVGFLNSLQTGQDVDAIRQGLREAGFVDGRNVTIEGRWAEGHYERLPALAADLVRRQVAVLVTTGGDPPALAAKAATSTIPIVFGIGSDPVRAGLVASLNRPGGNLTGVTVMSYALEAKRMGLLAELAPGSKIFAALINPNSPAAEMQERDLRTAGQAIGRQVVVFRAANDQEFETAFAGVVRDKADAIILGADPFFFSRQEQLIALARHYEIVAMYPWREFALAGGLMSYGTNLSDMVRQVGIYAGQVLKGEKPADLPVQQPTKFEFIINLKTAKALKISVPPGLSALADTVIE